MDKIEISVEPELLKPTSRLKYFRQEIVIKRYLGFTMHKIAEDYEVSSRTLYRYLASSPITEKEESNLISKFKINNKIRDENYIVNESEEIIKSTYSEVKEEVVYREEKLARVEKMLHELSKSKYDKG